MGCLLTLIFSTRPPENSERFSEEANTKKSAGLEKDNEDKG
jgi:hypothetical protein